MNVLSESIALMILLQTMSEKKLNRIRQLRLMTLYVFDALRKGPFVPPIARSEAHGKEFVYELNASISYRLSPLCDCATVDKKHRDI